MLRITYLEKIKQAFEINPCVALLGPRQTGKTTLAKEFIKQRQLSSITYLDLENPFDLARLDNPMLALQEITGLIVIDEIQRRPDLFPVLRVLIDQDLENRRFLILGSASRDLIMQSSETLAGRISYIEVTPFMLTEVDDWSHLWLRGGFPNSYLAKTDENSYVWRLEYISTFLEKDIPNLGIQVPARLLHRFWMMLAHYHGQIFNASEIGQALGVAHTSVRRYLDILTGTFMIRELSPWYENINKRQVKSPKIYFRDSGIFHALLGITDKSALYHHPKIGASWEGAALEEVIRSYDARGKDAYFWGVHSQGELDLLILKEGKRLGFEFKYTDTPKITPSMHLANDILHLDQLFLVHPGEQNFLLDKNIRAIGLKELVRLMPPK